MRTTAVLCRSSGGFHRMVYYDWGAPDNPRIVVCVHGLTRNGRDFDFIADALSHDFRVVCPDIAGRGRSDWLPVKSDYAYPQYLADLTALMARITRDADAKIDWVGTSMGALIGMVLASIPGNPLRRLVLNDAGVIVPRAALERIASYVGREPPFESLDRVESHLRRVFAPFGPLTDAQWRHLAVHGAAEQPDGTWRMRYDPAIRQPFEGELKDADFSAYWNAIACPTLILRGADSDVLPLNVAQTMTRRAGARFVQIEDVGHAPMLMDDAQVNIVRQFLLEP